MLKSKICFTVFVVYEIIAIMLLHSPWTCGAMFSPMFCVDSFFKYFLFCVAIPLLAFIIWMWIDEIFIAHRRHHSFIYRAKNVMSDVADDIKETIGKNIDMKDIDKYITAAILLGIKRYSDKHPQVRNTIQDIINRSNGYETYADYDVEEYDDEDDDYEYESDTHNSDNRQMSSAGSRSMSQRSSASGRTTSKSRKNSSSKSRNSNKR